jgi:hypothetical protein
MIQRITTRHRESYERNKDTWEYIEHLFVRLLTSIFFSMKWSWISLSWAQSERRLHEESFFFFMEICHKSDVFLWQKWVIRLRALTMLKKSVTKLKIILWQQLRTSQGSQRGVTNFGFSVWHLFPYAIKAPKPIVTMSHHFSINI